MPLVSSHNTIWSSVSIYRLISLISALRHCPTQREKPARLSALLNAPEIGGHFEHNSKCIHLTVPIAILNDASFSLYFQRLILETHWSNNVLGTVFLAFAASVNDKEAMRKERRHLLVRVFKWITSRVQHLPVYISYVNWWSQQQWWGSWSAFYFFISPFHLE